MHHWLHSITYTHANMVSICLDLLPSPTIESSRQFAAPWASRPCIASSHSQWCHSRKWHGSAFMSQVPFIFRKCKGGPKRGQQTSSTCQWNPPTKKQISRKSVKNPQNPFTIFPTKWDVMGGFLEFNSFHHFPWASCTTQAKALRQSLGSAFTVMEVTFERHPKLLEGGGWNKDMIKTIPTKMVPNITNIL